MKWFKFYGQDWLTDTKVISLSVEQRLCFITLLCLASAEDKNGQVSNFNEDMIIRLTQLYDNPYDDNNEVSRARGFLEKLEQMGMITMITNDNAGRFTYMINKFDDRQNSNLTGYERVKRFRENKKNSVVKPSLKYVINDNTTNVIKDNARIDKNRIDKNRVYTPASQDLLKVKNTKTMKKNSFGRYREDMPTDSYETVIDADTGEEEKYKPKGSNAKLMAELIEWAVKRRGGNFVNMGKQYKAIANLKQAKISPDAIKNRWVELESDEYHKLHGLDFMSVASSFDKKPL